jgi:hypothetical protein
MADRVEADNPQDTTPTAQSASVFISYASQDRAVADAACLALEQAGVACWIAPRNSFRASLMLVRLFIRLIAPS